ncbi:MAG TPA: aspartate kinase [Firmicutes bacterium]|nr:aspartate kinase [Bacillota bacterium]
MRTLVQKYGGTSLSTPDRRAAVVERVLAARREGFRVAVVVSAMGRAGDPYATDTLLNLLDVEGELVDRRERDLLLSCGEIISAVLVAALLTCRGARAHALTGPQAGIITDGAFGNAHIIEVVPARVLEILNRDEVAVVAGFQGATREGEITTLGRGGSDTTAAALGVALRAELVEIYTDVEGIMTADPRLMPEARLLPRVTYGEVAELAYLGAKVIHPRAVEIAAAGRVPLRIKSTLSGAPGTLIADFPPSGVEIRGDRVVTGIAHVPGLGQVKIRAAGEQGLAERQVELFAALAREGISVDLINVSPDLVSFAVSAGELERAREVLAGLGLSVEVQPGLAKVSAVGAGMRGVPGVMARVMAALKGAGIPVYQTADSHTNISCLVPEADLSRAVVALHREFHLEEAVGGVLG